MDQVRFVGRVLPVIHTVTIPQHTLNIADSNFATDVSADIQNSAVTISLAVERFSPPMLGELCRRAIRVAKAPIDLVSFSTGTGLFLVLDKVTLPDGRTVVPNLNFPAAPNLCTAYTLQNLTQILPMALEQD